MKRYIRSAETYNTYTIEVNFGGFIGADEEYEVDAANEDDAIDEALEMAKDDLNILNLKKTDEDEYEATVGFRGYAGVENVYTVYARDEDEAREDAIEEASNDLSAEVTNVYEWGE